MQMKEMMKKLITVLFLFSILLRNYTDGKDFAFQKLFLLIIIKLTTKKGQLRRIQNKKGVFI